MFDGKRKNMKKPPLTLYHQEATLRFTGSTASTHGSLTVPRIQKVKGCDEILSVDGLGCSAVWWCLSEVSSVSGAECLVFMLVLNVFLWFLMVLIYVWRVEKKTWSLLQSWRLANPHVEEVCKCKVVRCNELRNFRSYCPGLTTCQLVEERS